MVIVEVHYETKTHACEYTKSFKRHKCPQNTQSHRHTAHSSVYGMTYFNPIRLSVWRQTGSWERWILITG